MTLSPVGLIIRINGGYNYPDELRTINNKKGIPDGAKCINYSNTGESNLKRCKKYISLDGELIINKQKKWINENKGKKPQPIKLLESKEKSKIATQNFFKIYNQLKKDLVNIILGNIDNLKYIQPNEYRNYMNNDGLINWNKLYKRASKELKKENRTRTRKTGLRLSSKGRTTPQTLPRIIRTNEPIIVSF